MHTPPDQCLENTKFHQIRFTDSSSRLERMARFSGKDALQMILDSEEELTFSSEEDCNSDDERQHFQERIDRRVNTEFSRE